MKDFLKDLIDHTHGLGVVELLKVSGTDTETTFNAVAENKTVIISGTFKNPISDFIGTFGMPNLGKLKTILSFEDYNEDSVISMTRNSEDIPEAIHFETKNLDFVNDYRLMAKTVVEAKIKNIIFKIAPVYGVSFVPTVENIQKLKRQSSANSEEKTFSIMLKDNNLQINFGDVTTHSGSLVFQSNVSGTLNKQLKFPIKETLDILNLFGDKTFRISDQGLAEITVDSGLAVYTYLLPAQEK